jgi:hypothetical protein
MTGNPVWRGSEGLPKTVQTIGLECLSYPQSQNDPPISAHSNL